jgi:hypothetical protein
MSRSNKAGTVGRDIGDVIQSINQNIERARLIIVDELLRKHETADEAAKHADAYVRLLFELNEAEDHAGDALTADFGKPTSPGGQQ